jgi:hypothetical protein
MPSRGFIDKTSAVPFQLTWAKTRECFILTACYFIFLCNLLSGDVGTRGSLYVNFWNTQEIKGKTYDKNFLGKGTFNIFGCFCFTNGITKVVNHGRNREGIVIYVGVIQMIE